MTISAAFRRAISVYGKHPSASLKFWLVELCLTLICLTPLLFLAEPSLQMLALLFIPLYGLLMLPARVNAAAAMQDGLANDVLFSRVLADTSAYGQKLIFGLKRCLFLLLWGAPLIAFLLIARTHVSGEMDGFTLMRIIKEFGGGDLMQGVVYLALILGGTLLLLLFGCGFHSGDRHIFVLGRKKLPRGKMLGCWLCSLVILLPLLIALALLVFRYLPVLQDLNGLLMGTLTLPATRTSLVILAVGSVLTLPLLPLRSLVVAAYAEGKSRP